MEKLEDFMVPLHGLKEGLHSYNFKLDSAFLDHFDEKDIDIENVDVAVELIKNNNTVDFSFRIKAKVNIPCNRCLEKMAQKVRHEAKLIVKLGEQFAEISEEILEIPEFEDFDMAPLIFQYLMLSLPIRVVHKKGQCDPKMIDILNKYSGSDEKVDPRWDDLKKLLDNN